MSWTSCFLARRCPAAPVQIAAIYRRQTSKVSHKTCYVSSKHTIVSASCSWSPGSTRLAISWKTMERSRTRRLPTCRNAAPNLSTHWSRLRTQENQWPAWLFFLHALQLKSAVSSLAPHLPASRGKKNREDSCRARQLRKPLSVPAHCLPDFKDPRQLQSQNSRSQPTQPRSGDWWGHGSQGN